MKDRIVVITGATSGIGQVAADNLARLGARIIQVARDRARGEAALQRLREFAPNREHTVHYADLSRLREMKRVASEIVAAEPRVDVLINNVGAIFGRRQITEDGLEMTFAFTGEAGSVSEQNPSETMNPAKKTAIAIAMTML